MEKQRQTTFFAVVLLATNAPLSTFLTRAKMVFCPNTSANSNIINFETLETTSDFNFSLPTFIFNFSRSNSSFLSCFQALTSSILLNLTLLIQYLPLLNYLLFINFYDILEKTVFGKKYSL